MSQLFQTPIEYLKGVGPMRAQLLTKELNIRTYADLLHFFPFRHIDRSRYYKINELQPTAADVQIIGKITQIRTVEQARGKRLVADFTDGTGKMELIWFQGIKLIRGLIKTDVPIVVFGRISAFQNQFSIVHPEMELLSEHRQQLRGALQPVYSSTETLGSRGISNRIVVKMMQQLLTETHGKLSDPLPEPVRDRLKMPDKNTAMLHVHFPPSVEALNMARFRLKFEELFLMQLQLLQKNLDRKQKIKGHVFSSVGPYFNTFYSEHLPFPLTGAQKRVVREIRQDMGNGAQMNRLLQGDVGSGKTIVALLCMLLALDNGFQSCLMAPTEILAQQHFKTISDLASQTGITIGLLTGSTKAADRTKIFSALADGSLHLLIGTHALLEDKVRFHNLGLAVIDEQHRFGVAQRARLWQKNDIPPHILVMTATPIPRTLSMSLYGDLDVSVIDELPAGRKPIITEHRFESSRLRVWHFLKSEIAKGRQAYIVYPLIKESENMDYKDLMEGYEAVSRDFPLPQYAVSIVHGQMKPAEKEAEMQRFANGKTQIMVATTVIEVGVNVPNASVMVIESAERFGLSQLHQLRGRVGRGADQSYCILMSGNKLSDEAKTRLGTMVRTSDGFEIAEVDLRLRGPGDLMGTQQSGVLNLRIADIVKDREILQLARAEAISILRKDAALALPEHANLNKAFIELLRHKSLWHYIS